MKFTSEQRHLVRQMIKSNSWWIVERWGDIGCPNFKSGGSIEYAKKCLRIMSLGHLQPLREGAGHTIPDAHVCAWAPFDAELLDFLKEFRRELVDLHDPYGRIGYVNGAIMRVQEIKEHLSPIK